jgi:hypothetical protein
VPGALQRGLDFARELEVVLKLGNAARTDDTRVLEVVTDVERDFRRVRGRRKNQ